VQEEFGWERRDARGLTQAMNGTLTVESRPGSGTTSVMVLPAW
jgi:signal transduction histidine kinase